MRIVLIVIRSPPTVITTPGERREATTAVPVLTPDFCSGLDVICAVVVSAVVVWAGAEDAGVL